MGHQTQLDKDKIETKKGTSSFKFIFFWTLWLECHLKDIRKTKCLNWMVYFSFWNNNGLMSKFKMLKNRECIAIVICLDANIRSKRYRDLYADTCKAGCPRPIQNCQPEASLIILVNCKVYKSRSKLPVCKRYIKQSNGKKCLKLC